MVYVYKKTIGEKPYYYLRASENKGNKTVTKDIAYLGNTIKQAKKSLDKIDKEKIRKSYKKIRQFLESNHYLELSHKLKLKQQKFLEKQEELEACKIHFNSEFKKQVKETKKEIWENFIIEFAFNTASIEGNTITLKEARNLLEEGKTPKDRTLREIYDLQNTEDVFLEILEKKQKLNHYLIIEIHDKLLKNIDSRKGYRTQDVRVFKSTFKASPGSYVKTDMDILLKWYKENKENLHPLILATIFHHKFEKVHPFMDGNGRTGRMLLNYILLKNNHPPTIISRKLRNQYLVALSEADEVNLTETSQEKHKLLINFVEDEIINNYWDIFL